MVWTWCTARAFISPMCVPKVAMPRGSRMSSQGGGDVQAVNCNCPSETPATHRAPALNPKRLDLENQSWTPSSATERHDVAERRGLGAQPTQRRGACSPFTKQGGRHLRAHAHMHTQRHTHTHTHEERSRSPYVQSIAYDSLRP